MVKSSLTLTLNHLWAWPTQYTTLNSLFSSHWEKTEGGGGCFKLQVGHSLIQGLQYCCYYNPILKRPWDVHTIQSILCQHKKWKWTVTFCINASAKNQSERQCTVWFFVWSSVIIIHSKKCFQKLCTKVTTFFHIVSA